MKGGENAEGAGEEAEDSPEVEGPEVKDKATSPDIGLGRNNNPDEADSPHFVLAEVHIALLWDI